MLDNIVDDNVMHNITCRIVNLVHYTFKETFFIIFHNFSYLFIFSISSLNTLIMPFSRESILRIITKVSVHTCISKPNSFLQISS